MDYRERYREKNEAVSERLELAFERIKEIRECVGLSGGAALYFGALAGFVGQIEELVELIGADRLAGYSLEQLQKLNRDLYGDILPENYENSPANPAKTAEWFGKSLGQRMAFVAAELRGMVVYAYEYRLADIAICCELFIELYNWFELEASGEMTCEALEAQVKETVYYYVSDYSDDKAEIRVHELLDPTLTFAKDIIMESDLNDLRYLYRYGEYVSDNELKTAAYLNGLPEETIREMASTYTEGYRKGFVLAGIDLSEKTSVEVRFRLGFERVVREAIRQFAAMGLDVILYRSPVHGADKRQHMKIGYYGAIANPQYEYDHRNDLALFLDKPYKDRRLAMLKVAYEACKELAAGYAGPAVMETFGEEPFAYVNKPEVCALSEKQQKLYVTFNGESANLVQQYIDPEKRSFTIISYPTPEIGPDYEEIFRETIRLNTLDSSRYELIQQTLIDALDEGVAVEVLGRGGNRTDLRVALQPIADPAKQTGFENCLADVNIPLGEVFTSPQLEGTDGILHVSDIYLGSIRFQDLWLRFEDGFVVDYGCANDPDEAVGRKMIRDSIMSQHDRLPLGEFAIGTNTTAYAMAKKYDIISRLKILIIEKMGPHFAIGDTCYSHAEERPVYNPNGKEVIARENSCSLKRHEDHSKAYFNCHTDITVPYNELGSIRVIRADGSQIPLIEGGRFVLPGTQELNMALDELA
ncbi:MAG: aminopeptidase [Lachnospiraceae bacterium]|nr:aminopeptidase [Lachnospiraceae bacterium]